MSYLTHYNVLQDPFSSEAACGFAAADGETFGMTSEREFITCPDCIVWAESTQ